MKKIIFASGNKGKIKEVKNIFKETDFEIISLYDLGEVPEIIEDGETFEENSLKKAMEINKIHKLPTVADDSGLSVDQLDGKPGVYSARYAGENCTYDDNNKKILQELNSYQEPHSASFICCAVYYDGKDKYKTIGELPGKIIKEFRGKNGFGYDPIFIPDGFDVTLAEMSVDEKNKISHRSRAFNKLKKILIERGNQ